MIAKPEWIPAGEELYTVFRPVLGHIVETRCFADRVECWIWNCRDAAGVEQAPKFSYSAKIEQDYGMAFWMRPYEPVQWQACFVKVQG